ncbi:hypothetical protein BJF80_08645 [Serinicoccus sp. CUA-874]|nr:hypothetical protein BJF80_08645 [Serinicoccus sp. CUA-874]
MVTTVVSPRSSALSGSGAACACWAQGSELPDAGSARSGSGAAGLADAGALVRDTTSASASPATE